jgi:hypothetical protein
MIKDLLLLPVEAGLLVLQAVTTQTVSKAVKRRVNQNRSRFIGVSVQFAVELKA